MKIIQRKTGDFPTPNRQPPDWLLKAVWNTGSLEKQDWVKYLVDTNGWTAQAAHRRIYRCLKNQSPLHLLGNPNVDHLHPALIESWFIKRPRSLKTPYIAWSESENARGFYILIFFSFKTYQIWPIGVRVVAGDGKATGYLWPTSKERPRAAFMRSPCGIPNGYARLSKFANNLSVRLYHPLGEIPNGFEQTSITFTHSQSMWVLTNDRYKNYFREGFRELAPHEARLNELHNHYHWESLKSITAHEAEKVVALALQAWGKYASKNK
ncbi:MAG: hypothetical protein KatS3mg070_0025 [Meiothermus sp.]|uniref:hypothetical protein n=1 Tax=Meiothermus sp. TaxID=1955249 RepID=UPI0021DEB2E1|nr:hypothetical protein [Meiothermus sp.]GIW26662.1 MAG: hypothetical protein KatS3mg070_0025 [Meiothermus sp.]